MRILTIVSLLLLISIPLSAGAQMYVPDVETLAKARVVSTSNERLEEIVGTGVSAEVQMITAEILEGDEKGRVVTFSNDFSQLKTGDVFYLRHLVSPSEGTEVYSVADIYRLPVLVGVAVVFLVLLLLFGGIQGIRGLVALALSLVLIFYLLLPGIIKGYPPMLVAVGVSSLIIIAGSYITHGFTRTTSAAVLGMIGTVVVTGIAAAVVVDMAGLTGYNSEESTYLYFQSQGALDLVGILMSAILIGLLGVLYDVAIGQAVSVEELLRADQHLSRSDLYRRALRIGREHIGALVNTLAIAYVGASLPLLLLLDNASAPIGYILNGEVLATEIIRILIGSMGLVLAVPVTTAIAVFMIRSEGSSARNDAPVRHSH